jgi:hypothetical protein
VCDPLRTENWELRTRYQTQTFAGWAPAWGETRPAKAFVIKPKLLSSQVRFHLG